MTIFNFKFTKKRLKRQERVQWRAGFMIIEFLAALAVFTVLVVICSTWYVSAFILKESALQRILQLQNLYSVGQNYVHNNKNLSREILVQQELVLPRVQFKTVQRYSLLPVHVITLAKKENKQKISFVLLESVT